MKRRFPSLAWSALALALVVAGSGVGCGDGRGGGGSPGGERAGGPVDEAGPDPSRPMGIDPATIETGPRLVQRLLVIALDGATWEVLGPLMERGLLPNFSRLAGAGVTAELETLEPTVSPAIWTTIATGFLPRHHGILGFDGVPGATMETLPNSRMRKRKAYWEILSDFGVTTGTIGWWATWPADPLGEGSFLLSDRVPYTRMEAAVRRTTIAPDDGWPPGLLEEMAPLVERPDAIDPAVVADFLHMDGEEMRRSLLGTEYRVGSYLPEFKFVYQSDRSTQMMALATLADRPVDVLSVYFTGIDTVSHLYWHFTWPEAFPDVDIPADEQRRFGEVIPKYCRLVDGWIGELWERAGEGTTVLVVSDHGFGPTGWLPWSGGHGRLTPGAPIAPAGILLMAGPGFGPGPHRLEKAHVLDFAPTLLRLLGVPAGKDMLGRVLVEALAPGAGEGLPRVASHETIGMQRNAGVAPRDPHGDAERMERLRALGYLQ